MTEAIRQKIIFMAGGTGGHVFPALAVARELAKRGFDIEWLGTKRGIEAQLVPAAGFPLHYLDIAGIRGKGLVAKLMAPWKLLCAVIQAAKIMLNAHPSIAVGLGGFASGPGGIAAKLLHLPLIIHEQNARAGTTNKWLSRWANKVLTAFPDVLAHAVTIGNPIREDIVALPIPESRFAKREGPCRLLILGGSLGAQAINELIPATMHLLPASKRPLIRHQAGKRHHQATLSDYKKRQLDAEVMEFIDDVAAALAWADLVICRAGALTVSEIAAAGIAAIFIPFPHAIDDHQTANAEWLSQTGAAILQQQQDLNPEIMLQILEPLLNDRHGLVKMASKARAMAKPDATQRFADICQEFAYV